MAAGFPPSNIDSAAGRPVASHPPSKCLRLDYSAFGESVVSSAIGGENIGETVEGRARYPINVRYARVSMFLIPAAYRLTQRRRAVIGVY